MEGEQLSRLDYEQAVISQNACNLSGLVHTLDKTVTKIWAEANATGKGTDWVNTHPIVQLYVYQMFYLAFGKCPETDHQWDNAIGICEEKAK